MESSCMGFGGRDLSLRFRSGDCVWQKSCCWDSEFVVSCLGDCENMVGVDEGSARFFVVMDFEWSGQAGWVVAFIVPEDEIVDCH